MYRSISAFSYTVPDFETTGAVGGEPETGTGTASVEVRRWNGWVPRTGAEEHAAEPFDVETV